MSKLIYRQMNDRTRGKMASSLIAVKNISEQNGNCLIKAEDDEGRTMSIRVQNAETSNPEFEYANTFIADLRVVGVSRYFKTHQYDCSQVVVKNSNGESVIITAGGAR